MKLQVGKSTGLALAVLATLLATFVAMGVFSVAQAQSSATRIISTDTVEAGGTLEVTINLGGFSGQVVETLPDDFTYVSSTFVPAANGTVTDDEEPKIIFTVFQTSSVTYTVTAPDPLPEGALRFGGVLRQIGEDDATIGGDRSVNDPTEPAPMAAPATHELSTVVASAGVRIELDAFAEEPQFRQARTSR